MQAQILELKYRDYWTLLDITHLFCVEITKLPAQLCEIKILSLVGSEFVTTNIEKKFTNEEAEAVVESIKAIKNPRLEAVKPPDRGFFKRLFT